MFDRPSEQYELIPTTTLHASSHDVELSDSSGADAMALSTDQESDSEIEIENSPTESSLLTRSPSNPQNSALTRRTLRKLDFILLPFLSLLFLLNSLDRSNIGNAETAHFTRDAGLSPSDVNTAMAFFFAFFVTLQPVGAALGRRFGMGRWVPGVMVLWGLCTAAHVLVKRKWQLVGLRIAIGCLEAGFYPTTVSYLSLFYTRYEFGRRLGWFYGQYAVAGAVGGVVSWFVFRAVPPKDDGEVVVSAGTGWKPWQILFLLEGILTILVAAVGLVWLPRSASTAWFLNDEERKWAEERIRLDRDTGHTNDVSKDSSTLTDNYDDDVEDTNPSTSYEQSHSLLPSSSQPPIPIPSTANPTSDAGLPLTSLLSVVLLTPIWAPILLLNILSSTPTLAFSIFLPLLLSQTGLPAHLSNLLTAPPFFLGALTLFTVAHYSDKHKSRLLPIVVSLAISVFGLTVTLLLPETWYVLRYLALCVLLSASFVASPLTVAWLASNIPDPATRSLVLGINGWGNLAGVLSSLLFAPRFKDDGYRIPILVTMGFVAVSAVGFWIFRFGLIRENAGRDELEQTRGGSVEDADGWFNVWVRRVVGGRVLELTEEEWKTRRGGERLSFRYGL
jgi:MFS family permease